MSADGAHLRGGKARAPSSSLKGGGWFVAVLLSTLALFACTIMNGRPLPSAKVNGLAEEGGTVSDAGPRCADDAPFGPGRALAELNTPASEATPRISKDERTIYFDRANGDAGGSGLFQATRGSVEEDFGAPVPILPHLPNAHGATISASGLRLYFAAGELLGIHLAERATVEEPFVSERQILGATAESQFGSPFLSEGSGGSMLYLFRGNGTDFDLLRARVDPLGSVDPASLSEIPETNTDGDEYDPALSSDRLALYFTSNQENVSLGGRIFVARRSSPTEGFGKAKAVAELPQPESGSVSMGSVSADNCRIYYVSCTRSDCDIFVAFRTR